MNDNNGKSSTVSLINDDNRLKGEGVVNFKQEKIFLFSLKSSTGNGTVLFPVDLKSAL